MIFFFFCLYSCNDHWEIADDTLGMCCTEFLSGTIIDPQSPYFEPHENLDNITEVPILELHVAVMKKGRNWIF